MLNLSAKYDPNAPKPPRGGPIKSTQEAILYLSNDMMPRNLWELSTQTTSFKDAMLGAMSTSANKAACLPIILAELSTIDSVLPGEGVVICEFAATIAFMIGELELVKEILLRVPPQYATSYTKTLYTALALKKWSGDQFTMALSNSSSTAQTMWEIESRSLAV